MRLKDLEEKYEKLLEELEMQIKELKQNDIEENCKRWKANQDERYWYISSSGKVCHTVEVNDDLDKVLYEIGNYFKTEEEPKKIVEKMKIYTQLKDLALRLNRGKKIDWNDIYQCKYHIYYNYKSGVLNIFKACYYCRDIGQIYCLDEKFLEVAKQEIGEENLRKLFE